MARSLAFLCAGAPGPARMAARYSASMRWRSRSHATRASKVSPPCSSPIRYAETQNCCSAARKRCGRQVTPLLEDDKKRWRGFISPPVSLSRTRDLSGGSQTFTSPIKDLIRSFDPNTISHRPSTRKEVLKNLKKKLPGFGVPKSRKPLVLLGIASFRTLLAPCGALFAGENMFARPRVTRCGRETRGSEATGRC